jgi:DNA-binding winged helix-turn-helix (wHTH) protein
MVEKTRYRFAGFVLSPRQRLFLQSGRDVPLIPRYFDLLVLLLERRAEVVSRREIFDTVWNDVVVSDGALTQAVRILRRVLDDHPKQPRFIRTVSRHGYQFIHPEVIEESDDSPLAGCPDRDTAGGGHAAANPAATTDRESDPGGRPGHPPEVDPFENATRLLLETDSPAESADENRSAAAETLHLLGTAETLRRIAGRSGGPLVRAWLRETRWGVPGAGAVPIFGQPESFATAIAVIRLRMRRAARFVRTRWLSASAGGAAAGLIAGLAGGSLILYLSPPGTSAGLPLTFAMVAAVIGGIGAAGVGAGLATAEALSRSLRAPTLVLFGALGGGLVGILAHLLGRLALESLFGHDLSAVGGGLEGLGIGAGAGLGYALSTPRPGGGGMATPRRGKRLWTAVATGICTAAAAVGLAWSGGRLGGTSLDFLAQSFTGSKVGLEPLAALFGELRLGPVTRTWTAAFEGLLFGSGLALGLTRRPRRPGPGVIRKV